MDPLTIEEAVLSTVSDDYESIEVILESLPNVFDEEWLKKSPKKM